MKALDKDSSRPLFKFYGRLKGVRLSDRQAGLFDDLLPSIRLDLDNGLTEPGWDDVRLEIGFGGGEHLAFQAMNNPGTLFIGAEPFINGIAKLLVAIDENEIGNIRIFDGDARLLLSKIPNNFMSKVFLLYPDPWPKTRHRKRRFINKQSVEHFHRILKPGLVFRFASDIDDYVSWTLKEVKAHGGFELAETDANQWKNAPQDWISTRYEKKAFREGREPAYVDFICNKTDGTKRL